MLERLYDVQARDLELDALEATKGETPQELLEARQARQALQLRLEDKRQQHQALAKQVRANELELGALQGHRKAAASSAHAASSAKEASQYHNQELQFATRAEELESDTLPLMEQLEGLQDELDALQSEIDALQPTLENLEAQERERLAALEAQARDLQTARAALASGVEQGLLAQYEQVRRSRRGTGLALVQDAQRCGGCNVRLPIHVIQKARGGTGVTRCPSCGRLLWVREA